MADSDTRYRVRLPDGQVFDMFNLAQIKRDHPTATIEGRIVPDAVGIGILVPYQGQQPGEAQEALQSDQEGGQEAVNYDGMTVAQLQAELSTRGVEYASDARKADLVLLLQDNDQAGAGE